MASAAVEFFGARRVRDQVALGEPDTTHLQRDHLQVAIAGSRTGHQLGRPSPDVDHQKRPVAGVEVGDRAGHGQRALLLAGQELGGDPGRLGGGGQEHRAVGCVTSRGCRHHPGSHHSEAGHHLSVLRQHRHASVDGIHRQLPGGIDPFAQAGDPHQSLERATFLVDHEQAGRVGTAVDCRHRPAGVHPALLPRGQAGWRPMRSAVHSPTGSSAPVSHQARWAWRHLTPCRVPPTPPAGLGPWWSSGISASRSAA